MYQGLRDSNSDLSTATLPTSPLLHEIREIPIQKTLFFFLFFYLASRYIFWVGTYLNNLIQNMTRDMTTRQHKKTDTTFEDSEAKCAFLHRK